MFLKMHTDPNTCLWPHAEIRAFLSAVKLMFEKKVYSFFLFCNDGLNCLNDLDTFAEEI